MIRMQHIIREGHPTLTTPSNPCLLPLSEGDIKLGKDLLEYVINSQNDELVQKYKLRPSVGLAAPQINVLKRMFAMHVQDFDGKLFSYIMINPEITASSKEETYLPGGEGCLSVDRETSGLTPRYYAIKVKGYHLDLETNSAKPLEITLEGYPAIVFQHEFDHLNGVMFTSKLYPQLPNAFPLFEMDESEED
ncbi:peptide deformylase [Acholeplasma granularum]|uniref:peptide deformylase n=1 Tax=Acholeplasma granularum TaxID=264635 RepID=UPI000472651F|nr:peptide deformylase [Acholeplasma granularum]